MELHAQIIKKTGKMNLLFYPMTNFKKYRKKLLCMKTFDALEKLRQMKRTLRLFVWKS